MKILPMVRRAVPLMVTVDGVQRCVEVPVQAFLTPKGGTVLRIGDNTLWWLPNGSFDGVEACMTGVAEETAAAYVAALEAMGDHDSAPDDAYFREGSDGNRAETRGWPKREASS